MDEGVYKGDEGIKVLELPTLTHNALRWYGILSVKEALDLYLLGEKTACQTIRHFGKKGYLYLGKALVEKGFLVEENVAKAEEKRKIASFSIIGDGHLVITLGAFVLTLTQKELLIDYPAIFDLTFRRESK